MIPSNLINPAAASFFSASP